MDKSDANLEMEKEPPKSEQGQPEDKPKSKDEQYGFDHFPERQGRKAKASFWRTAILGEGREELNKIKCERKVFKVLNTSKVIFSSS